MVTSGTWHGFVDAWGGLPAAPYAGCLAVAETDLPGAPEDVPLRVVLTGGSAQLAGPVALCERRGLRLAALDTALRDPGDLAGNARRVLAALRDARPADDVVTHVRVPGPWSAVSPSAPAALDVLAEEESVVVALDPEQQRDLGPDGGWVEGCLDRELRVSLLGGSAADAVTLVERAGGRRWVPSWLTDDGTAAELAGLVALP